MIATMPGLENARIVTAGYAVEYDYVDPRELLPSCNCAACRACISLGKSTARPATKKPAHRVCLRA